MTNYFSPEAEEDFANVVGYLAGTNSAAAEELGARIFAVVDKLARGDFDGPEQVLTTGEAVRARVLPASRRRVVGAPHLPPGAVTDLEVKRSLLLRPMRRMRRPLEQPRNVCARQARETWGHL